MGTKSASFAQVGLAYVRKSSALQSDGSCHTYAGEVCRIAHRSSCTLSTFFADFKELNPRGVYVYQMM